MKKLVVLLLFLLLSYIGYAQLEVKDGSFKEVIGFVNINTEKMYDDNDKPYAVLKIKTENINDKQRHELVFQGNAATFFEIEYKVGEVWVYLSYYATYIKISHPDLSSTEFWFPFDMEPKKGYEITLVCKDSVTNSGWGSLKITTKPEDGAMISLNGKVLSNKTPYFNDMIPPGTYEITVSKERFKDVNRHVDIKAGENILVEIDMPYIYGKANISSEPSGASVLIDGKDYGVTPLSLDSIVVGPHELKLEKYGYTSITKIITIDNLDKLVVDEKLVLGREVIITTPKDGANIYVDDDFIGASPITTTLSVGEHIIKAEKDVYKTGKTIMISPSGDKLSLHLYFYPQGAINEEFSVSSTKKVVFSKGNLQYQASTKTWRFAEHQWDYIGTHTDNQYFSDFGGTITGSDNHFISPTYLGWIDLFGWGTLNHPTDTSTLSYRYSVFGDWGARRIENGGDEDHFWRTLTQEEWYYLIVTRNTISGIKYAKAIVNGVNGIIVLPDNWDPSIFRLNNTDLSEASFNSNVINISDWEKKMEINGAVFLPAAGHRIGNEIYSLNIYGYYWSSTSSHDGHAPCFMFSDKALSVKQFWNDVYDGCSVRLVGDLW